jgi:hypothetical protein
MTVLGQDVGEIEALVTDRYLDSLLDRRDRAGQPDLHSLNPAAALDEAVRAVSPGRRPAAISPVIPV